MMSEFDSGVWGRQWQYHVYCQRPECLEIHDCANRVSGYHCSSMRIPPSVEQEIADPIRSNLTLALSEAREPEAEHTVAWFYGEQG